MASKKQNPEANPDEATLQENMMEDAGVGALSLEQPEIPATADKILKIYPQYEKLYIDDKGGTYVDGSKLPENYKVTLYTNPYFKK